MTLARKSEAAPNDAAEVRAVLEAVAAGYRARDAATVVRHYAPDARIADLAPPLLHEGMAAAEVQAWIDGWDGPIEMRARDVEVQVDGDLAVAHGLEHTQVRTRDGEDAAWWCRVTRVLGRTPAGWRITHAHSSVPFYMDGSFRAAIDLEPAKGDGDA